MVPLTWTEKLELARKHKEQEEQNVEDLKGRERGWAASEDFGQNLVRQSSRCLLPDPSVPLSESLKKLKVGFEIDVFATVKRRSLEDFETEADSARKCNLKVPR